MAEATNPQSENGDIRIANLWGQVAQQVRKDVTNGFSYDPELVAAIIRADLDNIKSIEGGERNIDNELSFRQYDDLVRQFGLNILKNPVLFAALLAKEEIGNAQ